MLTSEEMEKITLELLLGKEPTIFTQEANEFRKKLRQEIEFAKSKGWVVEIPFEMFNDDLD